MTDVRPADRPDAGRPAFTADDIVAATGGELIRRSARPVRGAAVDSRLVRPGQLFVALPGERTDGHAFLADAGRSGAAALVVSRSAAELPELADLGDPNDPGGAGDLTIVRVADGLAALGALAAAWRKRFSPLVVGITGSIAKTSAKEATAAVLAGRFRTLKSEGNQNNEIGLPLTVLALGPEHEAAVLEMGMYIGGEIADLARIGRPAIGVVTAVQGVHLSRIGSLDAIEQAKGELVEALPPDGVAVLNADDPRVRRMAARTTARSITYGFAEDADVRATRVETAGFDGMRFRLEAGEGAAGRRDAGRGGGRRGGGGRTIVGDLATDVAIPVLGRLAVHNALAAATVGLAAGLDGATIAERLAMGWSAPHRGEVRWAGGVAMVDDAYNASPGSVAAALDLLRGLPGRRVAVLGEMLELGDTHERGHRETGAVAAAADLDLLVVVGAGASGLAEGALAAGMPADRVIAVADRDVALEELTARVRPGDTVLVKASRGAALEQLVEALLTALGERGPGDRGPGDGPGIPA